MGPASSSQAGCLALIVSDSWLDMRYGTAFKDYLLRTFRVRGMLGFQAQVFPDALVCPVVILAEKRAEVKSSGRERVAFVSLNGRMPKAIPLDPCRLLTDAPEQVSGTIVRLDQLRPANCWTPLLYAPRAYAELSRHPGMTPLASLAQVRIGLRSHLPKCFVSCHARCRNAGKSSTTGCYRSLCLPKMSIPPV